MKERDVKPTDHIESISETLLGAVQQRSTGGSRDQEAWKRLAGIFGPLVLRWCHWKGLSHEDSLDVSQYVMVSVDRRIDSFRREKPGDSFRGWLWIITSNAIKDFFRREQKEESVGLVFDPSAGADEATEQRWQLYEDDAEPNIEKGNTLLIRSIVDFAEERFKEDNWRAFYLSAAHGMDAETIAKELKINTNKVYIARVRVARRLKEEFGDDFLSLFPRSITPNTDDDSASAGTTS